MASGAVLVRTNCLGSVSPLTTGGSCDRWSQKNCAKNCQLKKLRRETMPQYYKDGRLERQEVPVPMVKPGEVLVRTHYSFVSVGTERMKVSQARMHLLAKVKERPDQVHQVMQTFREQGLIPTVRKVHERLIAPTTLGYSCSGIVVEVGTAIDDLAIGDRVACIGEGVATHAEFNAVPRNLVVRVPADVSLEAASAAVIGGITVQAIRQARLALGETVAIIGLGLLGQFLVQLCRANGCCVVGVDLDASKCQLAMQNAAEATCLSNLDEALHQTLRISYGEGVDVV